MLVGSVLIISRLDHDSQSKFQMFTLFFGCHTGGLRRSSNMAARSILGSIILRGTFRRIAQLWDNAHTLNLENCILCSSSIILQFLDFSHWMVFDFIFYYVTMNTLYCNVRGGVSGFLSIWRSCTEGLSNRVSLNFLSKCHSKVACDLVM